MMQEKVCGWCAYIVREGEEPYQVVWFECPRCSE